MKTPQSMRIEFFDGVYPWEEDPVETVHSLSDDETISLLWRGEDPSLPGFHAEPKNIKVKPSQGEKIIDYATLLGYTVYGEYLFRTNLLIKPEGMLARFINKLRDKESPNWAFRERAVIPSGRIINFSEV